MSHFSDGISAYKQGDYSRAIDEFHAAVEEDDQDHRAWNALGTALSKSGDYEGAATCFENALILAPDNATYLKNQDRNDAKRGSSEDEIELDDEPPINRPSIKVEEPLGLGGYNLRSDRLSIRHYIGHYCFILWRSCLCLWSIRNRFYYWKGMDWYLSLICGAPMSIC